MLGLAGPPGDPWSEGLPGLPDHSEEHVRGGRRAERSECNRSQVVVRVINAAPTAFLFFSSPFLPPFPRPSLPCSRKNNLDNIVKNNNHLVKNTRLTKSEKLLSEDSHLARDKNPGPS